MRLCSERSPRREAGPVPTRRPHFPQNAEIFTLTYGSMVRQLIADYEDVEEVNKQLDKMCAAARRLPPLSCSSAPCLQPCSRPGSSAPVHWTRCECSRRRQAVRWLCDYSTCRRDWSRNRLAANLLSIPGLPAAGATPLGSG